MHAERLEDRANEREELWRAIESLRLAEPSDVTGFTEIDRAHLTFGAGMPVVSHKRSKDQVINVIPSRMPIVHCVRLTKAS